MGTSKMIENNPDNCKIYTPIDVAKHMVELMEIDYTSDFKILEMAVGTGNIFCEIVKNYLSQIKDIDKIKFDLENKIVGFDIDKIRIERTLKQLDNILLDYNLNLIINWKLLVLNVFDIKELGGVFTHVISNPPYIQNKKLSTQQRKIMRDRYVSCAKHNIDLYYVFFEESIKQTTKDGTIVFITPNSYLNSLSSRALREVLSKEGSNEVFDFKQERIFPEAITNVAITKIKKNELSSITYSSIDRAFNIKEEFYSNNIDIDNYIFKKPKIKKGNRVDKYCYVSGGIATLDNDFYIIKETEIRYEEDGLLYFSKKEGEFCVELEAIEIVIRPESKKRDKIIFPYKNNIPLELNEIQKTLPKLYDYYCKMKKNNISFGRAQGLKYLNNNKLITGKITSNFEFNSSKNELINSGIYIVIKKEFKEYENLIYKQIIDENKQMKKMAELYCKKHNGGYYSLSTKMISNLRIKGV